MSDEQNVLKPFLFVALCVAVFLAGFHLVADRSGRGTLPAPPEAAATDLKVLLETTNVREKKQRFFNLMKPMVAQENAYILRQRRWLQQLNPSEMSEADKKGLTRLATDYSVLEASDGLPEQAEALEALKDKLMPRLLPIPEALVLVQAANESAWGVSRFAQQGNNLFGQWCFSKGCGLVPRRRPEGQYHEVAAFQSPQLSIRAYMNNLNSFWAYQAFRQARATLAMQDGSYDTGQALQLISHLGRYSERGQAYLDELKHMVQVNAPLIEAAAEGNLR